VLRALRTCWPYTAAVAVLLAVFALYTRPEFLVELANQVWTCF
jgi:hypothetical protein